MRVTNRMMTDNAIQHMSENLEQLHRLQNRNASGMAFSNASDDPVAASLALSLRSGLNALSDYKDTAALAGDWIDAGEAVFQEMENIATKANVLITRGITDSMSDAERTNSILPDLEGLLREAVSLANTKHNGQYLFSGFATGTAAYDEAAIFSTNTVTYTGGDGVMQRTIGAGKTLTINFRAEDVFQDFVESLVDARKALQDENVGDLRTAMAAVQLSMNTLNQYRTLNGTRSRQVQSAKEYLDKSRLEMSSLLSQTEEINLAEGISLLRSQETTYQVVLEVSQRAISTMNLFDYLR